MSIHAFKVSSQLVWVRNKLVLTVQSLSITIQHDIVRVLHWVPAATLYRAQKSLGSDLQFDDLWLDLLVAFRSGFWVSNDAARALRNGLFGVVGGECGLWVFLGVHDVEPRTGSFTTAVLQLHNHTTNNSENFIVALTILCDTCAEVSEEKNRF